MGSLLGITSITPKRSAPSPILDIILDIERTDAIFEALGTNRSPREKKSSCTIPGCKTQCTKHNDYGGFICDDHYKTWKENNA